MQDLSPLSTWPAEQQTWEKTLTISKAEVITKPPLIKSKVLHKFIVKERNTHVDYRNHKGKMILLLLEVCADIVASWLVVATPNSDRNPQSNQWKVIDAWNVKWPLKLFGFTFDEFTDLDCRAFSLFETVTGSLISQILNDVMAIHELGKIRLM